jgi:hypothetical protein
VAPNLAMLSNLVEAVEPRSPALRRVVLLQGSKWYGSHLGPYRTPADEDDPRLPVPGRTAGRTGLFFHDSARGP